MLQGKLLISAFCVTSIATLAGCGTTILSHRDTNQVIEDHAMISKDKVNVFATTASRRLAFITTDSTGKNKVICSEPPPDVGEAFASAIAAGLSGAVKATNPNIARTQDSRLIFLNFDVELWNSISFVPTRLRTRQISQRIGQKTGIMMPFLG